ncbi:hypothetical protein [Campylobacter sp. MG1]|uniref:hypothetical protein n=1 Tax=Campylobacter sp. MG1 TaxID=2976332 RepID=UPI00226C8CB4|nr:hypothetical protein [Campylobacter sp. MG1]
MDKMVKHTRMMAVASFISKFTYKAGGMRNPITESIVKDNINTDHKLTLEIV